MSSRKLLVAWVGLVVFAGLALAALRWRASERRRAEADRVHSGLASLYSQGASRPSCGDLGPEMLKLLENPYGRERMRSLDAQTPMIAFDETRHTVYYLHERQGTKEGEGPRSCIGWVLFNPDLPPAQGGRVSSHSALPEWIALQTVEIAGDSVAIELSVPEDQRHLTIAQKSGFAPGGRYRTLIPRTGFPFTFETLVRNARPK